MNPFQDDLTPLDKAMVVSLPSMPEDEKKLLVFKGQSLGKSDVNIDFLPKQIILGNVPSKSNCYKIITFKSKDPEKAGHASLGKTPALIQYEKDFFIQCNRYRSLGLDEYFEFYMAVYYPSQRSDLDNSLKVVLDCLQKVGAIRNDNKCTRIVVDKFLDKNNPRVEFVIKKSMK